MAIKANQIKNITIVGSGTLGSRIGLQSALSGYNVILYDIDRRSFDRAFKEYDRIGSLLVRRGILDKENFEKKRSTIRLTTDISEACNSADLISESVIEDVGIKKAVWKEISKAVPDHSILTTNTSLLLPSMFAEESGAPGRFAAFHFHDVFTARVVDIMPHPGTQQWVVELLREVGRNLNQIPVVIQKETPGYIFNKMFSNILMTAGMILAEGIADIEDIDRSWMGNYGTPTGPFGMMDEVGIDTVYHAGKAMPFPGKEKFLSLIREMIDKGNLGIKTGKGFYTYPNPSFKSRDFLS